VTLAATEAAETEAASVEAAAAADSEVETMVSIILHSHYFSLIHNFPLSTKYSIKNSPVFTLNCPKSSAPSFLWTKFKLGCVRWRWRRRLGERARPSHHHHAARQRPAAGGHHHQQTLPCPGASALPGRCPQTCPSRSSSSFPGKINIYTKTGQEIPNRNQLNCFKS